MNDVQIGDIIRHQSLGIVCRIAIRAGKTLAEIWPQGTGFGTVVELIERAIDPAVVAKPQGRIPALGDMVKYQMHEGSPVHEGRVWGVHLLKSGEALVRIGRQDAPLCRVIEFVGGAK